MKFRKHNNGWVSTQEHNGVSWGIKKDDDVILIKEINHNTDMEETIILNEGVLKQLLKEVSE